MGSCNFEAQFPKWIQTQTEAKTLNLSKANISGNFPEMLGTNTQWEHLDLSYNLISGSIPTSLCYLESLQVLYLSTNHFSGAIHDCWGHSSSGLLVMDLSSNKLSENIPISLTLLTGLQSLNLSHNFLSGNIPENIGDMERLELLDLSNNHLSGSIPSSISNLTSMRFFNLSNNNLQGRVPWGTYVNTLDDSENPIYAGNPLLCGEQLSRKCSDEHEEPVPSPREEQEKDHEDVFEKLMSYMAVMLGFATGFWGVVFTLVFNKTWRAAYVNVAEDAMGSVYVAVKVKMNKIKRRM